MGTWFYDAPAGMKDFQNPEKWHEVMADEAKVIVRDLVAVVLSKDPEEVSNEDVQNIAPSLAYVDPVSDSPPEDAETVGVAPWGGFPRAVERKAPWQLPHDPDDILGNFRAVEHLGEEDKRGEFRDSKDNVLNLPVRDRQDEYLEWTVRRNAEGKITKAIFVAEGYDYFSELFRRDEQKVVDIYREFTGVLGLTADDLRAAHGINLHFNGEIIGIVAKEGEFNPRNFYNINPGIVHLSHRANSLGAEVNLAGVSGIARKTIQNKTIQPGNSELLLCCSQGGNPNRNSDPLIGEQAYAQVLGKRRYTLANPVGLYIAGVEEQRLTLENGEPVPREWWNVVRGNDLWDSSRSRVLRLELEVPTNEGLLLGDLLVDGNPIKFGGQLAQLLSVHLFITRWMRNDNTIGPIVGCGGTCCKRVGTQELKPSSGKCGQGFQLAFNDLVPVPTSPHLLTVATSLVPSVKLKTYGLKSRLL